MNPVLAFEQYLVLKRHFTDPKFHIHDRLQRFPVTEATYIKYGSGTSKLVKKYGEDVYNYFIANFVAGDAHGGLYNGDEARDNYLAWKKRNQSLSYTFSQEMGWPKRRSQPTTLVEIYTAPKGTHTHLFRCILGKRVSIETLLVLDDVTNCIEVMDQNLADDFMWNTTSHLAKKYRFFFTYSFDPKPILAKLYV
jgi:hypothetical protein